MKRLIKAVLDLLYPRRAVCMGCGDMTGLDRNDLCETCRTRLSQNWIGAAEPPKRSLLSGTAFAYRYAGPAGAMVRQLKYSSVSVLADEMGRDLARAVELLRLPKIDVITAVPMHASRLRRRGGNHAEKLARVVSSEMNAPYAELLERTRNDRQQARLNRQDRRRNLKGAFRVREATADTVQGAYILLIDDVYTTGSTAKNCAETLLKAGAAKVYFAAYTRAEG